MSSLDILDDFAMAIYVRGFTKELINNLERKGILKRYKYPAYSRKRLDKWVFYVIEAFKADDSSIYFPHGTERFKLMVTSEETLKKLEKVFSSEEVKSK